MICIKTIGRNIRKEREARNMSQKALIDKLDITQGTLHNIESGNSAKVDVVLLYKICLIFNKSIEQLIGVPAIRTNGQVCCNNFISAHQCIEILFDKVLKQMKDEDKRNTILKILLEKATMINENG